MKKTILFTCFLSMMCGSMVYSETIGKSIATVNGDAIYLDEYRSNLEALLDQQRQDPSSDRLPSGWEEEAKKALLDQMIDEKLLLQEAKKRNEKVPKRQIEEGVQQVKNRFKILAPGSKPTKEDYERALTPEEQKEFDKELKSQGITEQQFQAKIEDQLKVLRLTEGEVRSKISDPFEKGSESSEEEKLTSEYDKEARALYNEIEKKFNETDFKPNPENEVDVMVVTLKSKLGEMVRASNILVKSPRTDDLKTRTAALGKIKAIKSELDKGADFSDLAEKKSESPGGKTGGDLGFFTRGQMIPEIEKSAFLLQVGQVSDVIESQFGYHLIQVTEKKAARRLRYDDIKHDLANIIYQKRSRERYEQFVKELKKAADIKITMDISQIRVPTAKNIP